MDIKQMKNFVSQELKGLKQEHRLLSLRRFRLWGCWEGRGEGQRPSAPEGDPPSSGRRCCPLVRARTASAFCLEVFTLLHGKGVPFWDQERFSGLFLFPADIGACESIMKKKTKQDFQELIKTEHGDCRPGLAALASAPGPAPSHPEKMLSGSSQLTPAVRSAGSC